MSEVLIDVSLAAQQLTLYQAAEGGNIVLHRFPVSTARNGAGEQEGSFCTPRGAHRIAQKIGDGAPRFAVFSAREATGEIWTPQLEAADPGRDWILSRILWLDGLEPVAPAYHHAVHSGTGGHQPPGAHPDIGREVGGGEKVLGQDAVRRRGLEARLRGTGKRWSGEVGTVGSHEQPER